MTTTKNVQSPAVGDGTGLAEALLGLGGFGVLAVTETPGEVVIGVETTADRVGCRGWGVRAEARTGCRSRSGICRVSASPAWLVWSKRWWRCREPLCPAKTWTEVSERASTRAVLTARAGVEACHQVGRNARPGSELADELGVCWWTIMTAVDEHGRPFVEDPNRVGGVRSLGVDETSFLRANRHYPTIYATGLVDLDERILIDLVEGNSATDLRRWLDTQPADWLEGSGWSTRHRHSPLKREAPSSVYATARTIVWPWIDPLVAEATTACTVGLDGLLNGPNTLYICVPVKDQHRLRPVLGGLLNDLMSQAFDRFVRTNEALDPALLVVIDEAATIGQINYHPGRRRSRGSACSSSPRGNP